MQWAPYPGVARRGRSCARTSSALARTCAKSVRRFLVRATKRAVLGGHLRARQDLAQLLGDALRLGESFGGVLLRLACLR